MEQAPKVNACNTAETNRNSAVVARDAAQEHYDTLVRASAGGLGATTSGTVREVGTTPERSQSVAEVADAVENIVKNTFEQDETQLFCIRVLGNRGSRLNDPRIQDQCIGYLVEQVQAERGQLYGLTPAAFRAAVEQGEEVADLTARRAQLLNQCAIDPARVARFDALVAGSAILEGNRDVFLREVKASAGRAEEILRRAGDVAEGQIAALFDALCMAGG